ncbi:MAG TPA: HAD-IIA family hydrolase [Intrasporangium sp.]|uniref:HAD-IIA family hydrolase n=1 Tax=Intrasporangium sp. TaxID=1925024 RepID=UPI002B45DA2A|nr:HAD-IIA family hydrolase [Intrasporangium sp.]HKX67578.1 HAD-IIA family hydrolase [Intrasporangium sp.]
MDDRARASEREAMSRVPFARASAGPIRDAYDGIVCDLDGVVYRGTGAVPGAPAALRRLAAHGVRIVYATNNASRLPGEVAEHLGTLGLPATAGDVVTSAQAGAAELTTMLAPGSRILALGGPGVAAALADAGLDAVLPGSPDAEEPVDAVLQGLGRGLTVRDFETAARHLAGGVVWVATNADSTLPLEWGLAPGNGAYVALLAAAVGREPTVVGKPQAPLYRAAVQRLGTRPEATLAVGDRLDTDIAGAAAAGLDSAWLLTGVHRASELLRHHEVGVPTWVLGALGELEQPYAAVFPAADGWTCAGGRVALSASGLDVVAGGARPVELVRAGLTAVLDAVEGGTVGLPELERFAGELDELLDLPGSS